MVADRRRPQARRGGCGGLGMSATATTTWSTDVSSLEVLTGPRATTVWTGGSGPALVFFTSEEKSGWNGVADALAASHTVYVPSLGATEDALNSMDGLHDMLIYVLDVLDDLGVDSVVLAGESFGAMLAAEVAAIAAPRVSKLVLLAPLGLWDDGVPVPDLYAAPPDVLAARLFGDATSEAATSWIASLGDKQAWVDRMRSMRTAMHFVFPIAEIGLSRRIHRVTAPTLLVWGTADGVVAPSYAAEFCSLIPGSTVTTIDGAGHYLSAGHPSETATAILNFLG